MEFLTEFPEMGRQDLRDFKKAVDASFKSFSRNYGDALESFFEPLLWFLVWLEKLLTNTPWPIIIAILSVLAWLGSRSWKLVAGTAVAFVVIGYFGMWEDTMATLAIISVATLLCISLGIGRQRLIVVTQLLQAPDPVPRIARTLIADAIDLNGKTFAPRSHRFHIRRQVGQITAPHVLQEGRHPGGDAGLPLALNGIEPGIPQAGDPLQDCRRLLPEQLKRHGVQRKVPEERPGETHVGERRPLSQ